MGLIMPPDIPAIVEPTPSPMIYADSLWPEGHCDRVLWHVLTKDTRLESGAWVYLRRAVIVQTQRGFAAALLGANRCSVLGSVPRVGPAAH